MEGAPNRLLSRLNQNIDSLGLIGFGGSSAASADPFPGKSPVIPASCNKNLSIIPGAKGASGGGQGGGVGGISNSPISYANIQGGNGGAGNGSGPGGNGSNGTSGAANTGQGGSGGGSGVMDTILAMVQRVEMVVQERFL